MRAIRTNFIESIFRRHFGVRAESVVENFIESPQMDSVLADMDAAQVARRAELAEQLRTVPERHEARACEAYRAAERAKEQVHQAEAAVTAATQAYSQALSHFMGLSAGYEREKAMLTRELQDTADPRLEQFAAACTDIFMQARHLPSKEIRSSTTGKLLEYDSSDVNRLLAALSSAGQRARELKLLALSYAQITEALTALRNEIAAPIAAVGARLEPPAIEGADSSALTLH